MKELERTWKNLKEIVCNLKGLERNPAQLERIERIWKNWKDLKELKGLERIERTWKNWKNLISFKLAFFFQVGFFLSSWLFFLSSWLFSFKLTFFLSSWHFFFQVGIFSFKLAFFFQILSKATGISCKMCPAPNATMGTKNKKMTFGDGVPSNKP